MHESWTDHESWVYQCNRCLTTWHEEFDATHTADGHGGEAVVYWHDGQECMSPWCDQLCPKCHSPNVTAYAAPWTEAVPVRPDQSTEDLALRFHLRRMGAY